MELEADTAFGLKDALPQKNALYEIGEGKRGAKHLTFLSYHSRLAANAAARPNLI